MDLLAIESFVWSPHLETCVEICVSRAETETVGLCILEIPNLDDPDIKWTLFGRFGRARRIRMAKRIAASRGVRVVDMPAFSEAEVHEAVRFSNTELRSFADLLALRFRGESIGFGVGSSLVDRVKQEDPSIELCRANGLTKYLLYAAMVFLAADKLTRAVRPKTVLTFNGRFANARPIALAARANQVKMLFHEGTDHFERYRVAEATPHDFEWWRSSIEGTWKNSDADDNRTEIGVQFFERRLAGSFHDGLNHLALQRPNILPVMENKKRVVFFSQSDEEYSVIDGLVHPLFSNQRESILWLIDHYSRRNDVQFIVRIHPNLLNKGEADRRWWHSLKGTNLTLIPADSPVDSYELVRKADIVLTYCNASIGIEATYLERPSVVLGDSVYKGIDAAYHPASLGDLERLLDQQSISPKPKENVLPYGYFRDTFGNEFKLYKPETRLTGKLAGVYLGIYPRIIEVPVNLLRRLLSGIPGVTRFFSPNRFTGNA